MYLTNKLKIKQIQKYSKGGKIITRFKKNIYKNVLKNNNNK